MKTSSSPISPNHTNDLFSKTYHYHVTQETIHSNELGSYVTYGIRAECNGESLAFVSDVSLTLEQAQRLAELCTECQLSPIHLCDVIEDFLADPSVILSTFR